MRNGKKETDARKTRGRSPVTGWSDGRTFGDLVAEMEGKSASPSRAATRRSAWPTTPR